MENNFKNARELCDLSQKAVAIELGVSAPTVSEWESGKKVPTVDNLLKLKNLFGTTVDYLLGITNDPCWYSVPSDMSLRGVSEPEEQQLLLSSLADASKRHENSVLINAINRKALSLSERAMQVAIAYDCADERARQVVDLTLEPFSSPSITGAPTAPVKKTGKRQARPDGFEEIDIYDQPAAAGLGNYLDVPVSRREQYPAGIVPAGTSFGVLISGDSMEPRIADSSTVFVQASPAVNPGEIGVFVLNGLAYCKQLRVDRDARRISLHSFNYKYGDIRIAQTDELRTIGRVLGSYPPVNTP